MNWQDEAIRDLQSYNTLKDAQESIKLKMLALNEMSKALKSTNYKTDKVQGGKINAAEETVLNNIAERQRLSMVFNANEILIKRIDKGLKSLSYEEKTVLQDLFINCKKNAVLELSRKLAYEKTKIYNLRNNALKKFTMGMYGIASI